MYNVVKYVWVHFTKYRVDTVFPKYAPAIFPCSTCPLSSDCYIWYNTFYGISRRSYVILWRKNTKLFCKLHILFLIKRLSLDNMNIMVSLFKMWRVLSFEYGLIHIHIHLHTQTHTHIYIYIHTLTPLCPFDRATHNSQKKMAVLIVLYKM
jgi:hypothetical protein